MNFTHDIFIVGQGLAGSTLAEQLMRRGMRVLVINKSETSSSSRVAAGMYNPITGNNMVLTWRAAEIFPYLREYYSGLEQIFNTKFLFPLDIYRPFIAADEFNDWMGRSVDPIYSQFVKRVIDHNKEPWIKADAFGGLEIIGGGYVDLPIYLDAVKKWLQDHGAYSEGKIDFESFNPNDQLVVYKKYSAPKIIFCNGPGLSKSGLFDFARLSAVKGEILTVELNNKLDYILNRGVFVIPRQNGLARIGATYERDNLELKPTEKGRSYIIEKQRYLCELNYKISDQLVGLRPIMRDRKPILGWHHVHKHIGVFNGLGAKGVSLAPFFSNHFAEHIVEGKELDAQVNVARFL